MSYSVGFSGPVDVVARELEEAKQAITNAQLVLADKVMNPQVNVTICGSSYSSDAGAGGGSSYSVTFLKPPEPAKVEEAQNAAVPPEAVNEDVPKPPDPA